MTLAVPFVITAFALVSAGPASAAPVIASLGAWSDPVEIMTTEGSLAGAWDTSIYVRSWEGMAISHDRGNSWQPETPFDGVIAVENYVMYRANLSNVYGPDIFFSKSLDNGTTWSSPVKVMTFDDGNDGAYRIFKFDTTLIVYTYDGAGFSVGHLEMSRSTDYGATWSDPIMIDDYVHVEDPSAADMVLMGGNLYLAYSHYTIGPGHVVTSMSEDMGLTWVNRSEIATGNQPRLKEDGGILYLTYLGSQGSKGGVLFTKSVDGVDWSTAQVVGPMTDFTDPSSSHSLAVSNENVFVGYMDYTNNGGVGDTYFVRIGCSQDYGDSWSDLGNVTGGNGDEMYPSLLISSGHLHFAWVDAEGAGGWGGDTYYRHLEITSDPIPEFGTILVPVLGTAVAAFVLLLGRRTL